MAIKKSVQTIEKSDKAQKGTAPSLLYDASVDILYIRYTPGRNTVARKMTPYIMAHYDRTTGEIAAATVFCYKWLEENQPEWKAVLPTAFRAEDVKTAVE